MTTRWTEILDRAGSVEGTWLVLPENGIGAVTAYEAGPGRARPHDVPLAERRIALVTRSRGAERRDLVAMSSEDREMVAESISGFLADIGLPASPCTWWEIVVPVGLTAPAVERRLESAASGVAAEGGIEYARELATALRAEVRRIYA